MPWQALCSKRAANSSDDWHGGRRASAAHNLCSLPPGEPAGRTATSLERQASGCACTSGAQGCGAGCGSGSAHACSACTNSLRQAHKQVGHCSRECRTAASPANRSACRVAHAQGMA